ncbi:peptidylprolyl isomerase [Dyella japonica]|uniref:peptidylprolyl isomerase n=1 Tax=Dyella japonica A8 TaxID=1217721 RepID=A0A075K4S0_9GAMM|nr:peptidylprolyl isomerase [Dyella japonica]AIF48702.1 peptidylprolyl isomerase [Dyella japonica A8]
MLLRHCLALALAATLSATVAADEAKPAHTPSPKDLLAKSQPQEWRVPDPRNVLVMQLPQGRVLIELAPDFTPLHVANIRTMAHEHYYDGLVIERVQDNFVTQWGDAANEDESGDKSKLKPLGSAKDRLPPEYTRPYDAKLPFTALKDGDFYAPEVGFSEGFPAARDKAHQQQWLTHCYGMVGVGRDIDPETGSGSELYAVIGQAPRALDRNIALVGRVLQGMEYLSGLPRGTGPMGFYEKPEQRIAIRSVRLASDLPAEERPNVEVLRTDSVTFAALVDAKRNRFDDFYRLPAGKVDVCSVNIPVRDAKTSH